jgi:hypothetical protein
VKARADFQCRKGETSDHAESGQARCYRVWFGTALPEVGFNDWRKACGEQLLEYQL